LGVEYVVGGVHWPMYIEPSREAVIQDYHRQYIFLAAHPLVDIIAHPWWWNGHWRNDQGDYETEPWFDDFRHIPGEMHDEFASTVIEHGKKVEVNVWAMLINPHYSERFVQQYLDYLVDLQSSGVLLCIGSDCHSAHYDVDFETTEKMLRNAGIKVEKMWCMPPRNSGESANQGEPENLHPGIED
jgi:histidinol phosphatase-like PHP family hydrolase